MIKLLTHPFTKILLFLLGWAGFISILRELSHTLNVLINNAFGAWFYFGFLPSLFLLTSSGVLLLVSIWKTKGKALAPPLAFWRKLDAFLLSLFAVWGAVFLVFSTYSSWDARNWDVLSTLLLPLLAYALLILAAAELTARLRDKTLGQTMYWLHFFRIYPLYKPLGFLFALALAFNLFILLSMMTAPFHFRGIGSISVFLFLPQLFTHPMGTVTAAPDITNLFFLLAAITLIALTYFAVHLLNLSAEYDKANEEKIRAERFKGELITNVSHDIRTPLTSIINYVDLLKLEPLDGKSAEYISVLEMKAARLKTLIDDLMDASKAGTGSVSVKRETVNLTELLGQVAGEFEDQLKQRNLTLVLREPDTPIFTDTDSRHLWRTLENLFSNAAKYALPGTRVFAELVQREHSVVFTLKNTSARPIHLSGDTLTEQFIRGDMARESEGSGLGLYIAKSLVELMNGQFCIDVSGDLFTVEIVL